MINVKKLTLIALFAIMAIGVLGSSTVEAQTLKIGIVNDEDIKKGYEAWGRAVTEFETERKAWDEEAQTMNLDLQEMLSEYERQKLILSEEKRNEKEAAIRVKEESLRAFTSRIYGPGGAAEKKQELLMVPLLDKVSLAIQTIAEADGFDVIFTMQSGLGYIKPTYDVTQKVLDALEDLE